MVELTVNGVGFDSKADPRTPFLEVLREELGLRGAKYGCGEGECGACTVVVDGETVCACLATTGSLARREVTTVEGLANDPIGVRLINSLAEKGAVQCGFCTPGFVLSGWQLLARDGGAGGAFEIREAIAGNLCRCTGYVRIIEAIADSTGAASGSPLAGRTGRGLKEVAVARTYWRPTSLEQLLSGIEAFHEQPSIIAGGTDLMVRHEHHLDRLALVDISGIAELEGIEERGAYIRIGAATSWTDIRRSALLKEHAPLLPAAAAEVGGIQIQNRATIGGNIVNASPAADGLPPLYAYEADVVTTHAEGMRITPIADFVTGPGQTRLGRGELVTEVRIPKHIGGGEAVWFFEKVGSRQAQTITKGSIAFCGWRKGGRILDPRIAIGAAAPTVIRARLAEEIVAAGGGEQSLREAARQISACAQPIDDIRSSADYRRRLVGGLFLRGFARLG